MARTETYTIACSGDGAAIDNGGASLGQGKDPHLVCGLYGGYLHRPFLKFGSFVSSLRDRGATQVLDVKLKAKTTSYHVALGSGTVQPRRVTESFDTGTRGADESWYTDNALEWSNKPSSTISGGQGTIDFPGSGGTVFSRSIMKLLRSVIPADILDDQGNPGGGNTFYGIELRNNNEGSSAAVTEISSANGSYTPLLEITISTNVAPEIPINLDPPDGGTYADDDGIYLVLSGDHVDVELDPIDYAENELYFPTATQSGVDAGTETLAQSDPGVVTTGDTHFRTTYEVGRRTSWKTRARTQDEPGMWGPWSPLRSVSIAAKPKAVNVSVERGTRTPLFGVSIEDPDQILGGIIGTISAVEVDAWTNVGGGGRVYLWTSGMQAVGGNPKRATLLYGSGGTVLRNPEWGESIGYRIRLTNDAGIVSDYTADASFVPVEVTGPATLSPKDRATKIDTLTPALTVGDTLGFDQISYRWWATEDAGAALYSSGSIAVGSTTVRSSSASGQAVLQVNSIAGVQAGDVLRVDEGGASFDRTVLSTNAVGPTITFTTNLPSTATVGMTVRTVQATRTSGYAFQWGASPWWDAAVRTNGNPSLGVYSPRYNVQLNTLPTAPTVSVATPGSVYRSSDATWIAAGANPLLRIPFEDVDEGAYGETPARKTIEIRVASSPTKGTGTLVETRTTTVSGLGMLPEDEYVGERLSTLDSATGWTASPGTVTVAATNPTGYGGSSVQYSPGSLANGASGFLYRALSADEGSRLRSSYSGGTLWRLWARLSVLITGINLRVKVEKVGSWSASYQLATGLTASYVEGSLAKQAPTATTGTPWSSDPDRLNLEIVNANGASQSPVVLMRDLRFGTVQTAKTVPDGYLALESSYDVRGQWGDAAAPGSMGAWSPWQTIKAGTLPAVTPLDPLAVATDDYGRTLADQWGSADVGGAYTLNGTAADFDVASGKATIVQAVSTGRDARLATVSQADVDVTIDVESDKVPTTAEIHSQIRARHNNATTFYRLMLYVPAGGTGVALQIHRLIAGVASQTGMAGTTSVALPDWTANVPRRMRLQVAGTGTAVRIRGKVWDAATVEPAAWDLDVTDTDAARIVAAGSIELGHWVGPIGNAPMTWKHDRLRAVEIVRDPTPSLDWSAAFGGAKTGASFLLRIFERSEIIGAAGFVDALIATVSGTSATIADVPAGTLSDGRRYAWDVVVTDSDGLTTTSARHGFATSFEQAIAPSALVLTPASSPPSVLVSWTASTDPYLVGYAVSRRAGAGAFVRINAQGDPDPDAVIVGTSMTDYRAPNGVALDYAVQAINGAADDATGLSTSIEGSTSTAVDGWYYVDPGASRTDELRFVVDWAEEQPISHYVADPLPDDDLDPEPAIVIVGDRQGRRVRVVLELAPEDAELLERMRAAAVARDHSFGYLKSPLGDVWAGRWTEIRQSKAGNGPGRRRVEALLVETA